MVPAEPAIDETHTERDDDDRELVVAIAQGLADDAAGRVMATDALEAGLTARPESISIRLPS